MAYDAFISYSQEDKAIADSICQALENDGLKCWYAPRDVEIGADWDASIMEALASSSVMILVWSSHSDKSRHVKRELAIALDDVGVSLIPYRTEVIEPSKLRYYLGSIQWLDASSPNPDSNLQLLIRKVRTTIEREAAETLAEKKRLEAAEPERLPEEKRKAEELERQRLEAQAREREEAEQLAEKQRLEEAERERLAAEQKAEELERQRLEAEARKREEAARVAEEKRLEEAERQRIAEEKRKAEEFERQRLEAETRKRREAEERERREAAARQRETEQRPFGIPVPSTISQPPSELPEPYLAATPVNAASLSSYGSAPDNQRTLLFVGIAVAVLLLGVAGLAYALWPSRPDRENQRTEVLPGYQSPTPEEPTPVQSPELNNPSAPSPAKATPTPRKSPSPERGPPRAPISGGVLNGKAISLPLPRYPPIARQAHASGTVVVQVIIDENGNVMSATPISGHPLLQTAAVGAARQAKFSPTLLSGERVKITGVIRYNFVADQATPTPE